ncbi:MAG: hypothetical protein ACRDHW_16585 [Ktedonobacteraceae bacterium]
MALRVTPGIEIELPDTSDQPQTQTRPQRSDGWFTRIQYRVKLAMSGDDEELLVVNNTAISWRVYHNYHLLGIIDPGEDQVFRLQKRGQLKVCPSLESDAVEYLVLDLNGLIAGAEIYRRHIGQELETYEMRSA